MSSGRSKRIGCGIIVAAAIVLGSPASAQTSKEEARERLIGAWHLIRIDAPGPHGKPASGLQPKGMLVYTRDGHMSVQLMYPSSAHTLSNEYALNGYEASFGSYDVDETTQTVIHHVQGSITGDLLVGKDLPRKFEFTPEGHLIIRSPRPDEHWFVTWAHY